MNPFFFGTRERRLFGLYTPGRGGGPGARAAVLCHPWGQEYLRAHRSMRHLATLLSRGDVHVLRFDFLGTGDSAGDITDGDLDGWQADVELAIDELRDTTGVARVGLVGLRLGATLAAGVAARRRADVDRLVLWDPVVRGDEYADELSRAASDGVGDDGTTEVLGFLLTKRMAAEIRAVDLIALAPALPDRTFVIASEPLASHGALRAALGRREFEEIASPPAWLEDRSTGVGAIPVPVLRRISQWWDRP
jgi:pimeloyl-ACP methyl ester carboxylesterase